MSRLRHFSNWLPTRTGHSFPPIVEVPLAAGYNVCFVHFRCCQRSFINLQRNAVAGAPAADDGYVLDEVIDSRPPSQNSNCQSAPAGEHGSGRLCFCF